LLVPGGLRQQLDDQVHNVRGDAQRPSASCSLCSLQTGPGGVRDGERPVGLVLIHDTLTAPDEPAAGPFARPVLILDADFAGVLTLAEVLRRLLLEAAAA
jgi:hypothetical protein